MRLAIAFATLLLGVVPVVPAACFAQLLTWDEVTSLDWSGPIPMELKAATDGVFEGGPDYCRDATNEWLSESDVVYQRGTFTISIYNNRDHDMDDLIFLVAYDSGSFSSLTIGSWVASPVGFYDNDRSPFGPGGGRPGDGEAALYNGATGVAFVRVGQGVLAKEITEVQVSIAGADVGTRIHFDFYGLVGSEVVASCAASNDVTWQNTCAASPTERETWSTTKAAFRR
jgi:hypothetical protein